MIGGAIVGRNGKSAPGFVIDSLPRSGSTTLARLLGCHPDIQCIIEPFHPTMHGGGFRTMALNARSVAPVLNLIWHRWTGLKHVWDPRTGWPFAELPDLNDEIVLGAGRLILLERRNRLRRYISGVISGKLRFWVGTREEFIARLDSVQLPELDPAVVREHLQRDRAAMEERVRLSQSRDIPAMRVFYEELYGQCRCAHKQLSLLNEILEFLGFSSVSEGPFRNRFLRLLDPAKHQWGSAEIYRRIPGVLTLEDEVGSDESGWLFKEVTDDSCRCSACEAQSSGQSN